MGIILGSIADDYTGASDLANTLSKNGLRTVQTIGIPDQLGTLPDIDAVVISLKIRSVPAGQAVEAALTADRWLRAQGARHVMYKICSTFDSTDAGNIGPVTDALREHAGADIVLVTPAFPETGRTMHFGYLFVGDQLLSESPLKDHPLNPMHDPNLIRVLARQSHAPVGLIDLATVAAGPEAIRTRLDTLSAAGVKSAIIDAIFAKDLESMGEVAQHMAVSTGASGLGLGLARAMVKSGWARAHDGQASSAVQYVGGLSAIVAGSCSKATLEQIEVAEAVLPVLRLDTEALMDGTDVIASALSWAGDRLSQGPVLISASAAPEAVSRLQATFGREASGHAIEAATSTIVAELVKRGVRRLIVAGGETSGAAVDKLGIPAFLIGPEIAPGVPILQTIGGPTGPMQVALKSGNFGGRDFFTRALAMMQ